MRSSMINSGRTIALAVALAPLAARPALAQQNPRSTVEVRVHACALGRCADDSSRVVVTVLMNKLDSLQRIFLGTPIAPEQQERMASEMSDMLSRIAELQRGAMEMSVERAGEASRKAMADAGAAAMLQYRPVSQIPPEAVPKGWIGLTFVGAPVDNVRHGEYFVRFLDYPEVESVEPDSPAEHAGIAHGDLLLAFNGQDVTTQDISMTRLLEPDHKVVVRMERNGVDRDYPLIVARAPQMFVRRRVDFATPDAPVRIRGVLAEPPAPPTWTSDAAPAPRTPVTVFNFSPAISAVAGASMSPVNPDLGRAFGVDRGVLVLQTPHGTVAEQSGLRAGDVIVTAAGAAVTTVDDLRRVLEWHAADATVELRIVRNRKSRTLQLKQ
ncbi:MAG: PDZ domain-containing protein [Gemmatimonadaceae bacterium]